MPPEPTSASDPPPTRSQSKTSTWKRVDGERGPGADLLVTHYITNRGATPLNLDAFVDAKEAGEVARRNQLLPLRLEIGQDLVIVGNPPKRLLRDSLLGPHLSSTDAGVTARSVKYREQLVNSLACLVKSPFGSIQGSLRRQVGTRERDHNAD